MLRLAFLPYTFILPEDRTQDGIMFLEARRQTSDSVKLAGKNCTYANIGNPAADCVRTDLVGKPV
ncbi:hypothetical protein TorRG33x02_242700 [Trema orientale]|uniref:Uncharacterized protein n=1 Tax=Trema orientale TaxID=63057 RepID=A0A2P5DSR1_TREOI|nr:hypothetical protein TorRG33x02_242700 [Trema orientale]